MHTITEHEFIKNAQGQLALLVDALSPQTAADPVLLVSGEDNMAYLQRGKNDVHEITGIDPDVIELVRKANNVLVIEMKDKNVLHSYDALTGILEGDDGRHAE
jgi:hypothetical protein